MIQNVKSNSPEMLNEIKLSMKLKPAVFVSHPQTAVYDRNVSRFIGFRKTARTERVYLFAANGTLFEEKETQLKHRNARSNC